ncbi:MAG TPA: AAA family ATPase [Solirubrobacteraceae bacterium]|nr:AAA family ATPase [Solirubrobacteraceae bacterium]
MSRRIAAVLAHDDSVPETLVTAHIPVDVGIELVTVIASLEPDSEGMRRSDIDVLLIACREHSADGLALVEWWREVRPGRPVVLLSPAGDNSFVQRVFTAGANDLVILNPGPYVPEQSRRDVEFAIRKAVARSTVEDERSPDAGEVIAVLGPKGGTGKTVAATNLATALARRGRRTVLVDLDLQFGDVTLALGLMPEVTVFDLAVSGGSLDAEKLDDFLLRHPSGLRVLSAPVRPDQAGAVSTDMIVHIYELLASEYDYVVIDTPRSFSPEVISTIDSASWLCMVAMLDALSLKNTRLGLETLDLMGYAQDRVRVVLNRAGTAVGLTEGDAVTILGRTPDVHVPSDRSVAVSLNDGVPVVISQRRSEVAKAFEKLAGLFTTEPLEEFASEAESEPQLELEDGAERRRFGLRRRSRSVVTGEVAGS